MKRTNGSDERGENMPQNMPAMIERILDTLRDWCDSPLAALAVVAGASAEAAIIILLATGRLT